MNDRSKTGVEILQVALVMGLLGDVLLRQMPWGLNVLLFNLAFVAGTIMLLMRRKRAFLTPQAWALLGAQVFFASMFVWRDSGELHFADSVAIVAILSVLFVPQLKVPARIAGAFHYIVGFLLSSVNAAFAGFALLFADIKWNTPERSGWAKNAIAVVRGVLIVAPLILIFGGLFVAADAAYQGMVERVLNINPATLFSHAILFAVFGWASAGYLRGVVIGMEAKPVADPTARPADSTGESKVDDLKNDSGEHPTVLSGESLLEHINKSDPPDPPDQSKAESKPQPKGLNLADFNNLILPSAFTLGAVEVGVILGLLDLLFLSFVIVQIPYLFGGMDFVQNTPDFKLAEYARRGFGELVAVSALVLPVLLVGHWLIRKDNPVNEKLFRALAGVQLVLLFAIMASAVQRLVILTGPLGYGMTTVRLYPMIFMIWLGVVFVWFALTVLRGSRQFFAWGALWSAFVILGATHFLNPDEFIVRTNVKLMQQGRQFDANYNAELSADATPALVESLVNFNDADSQTVIQKLTKKRCRESADIRSWNYSRWKVSRLLDANTKLFGQAGDCTAEPADIANSDDF